MNTFRIQWQFLGIEIRKNTQRLHLSSCLVPSIEHMFEMDALALRWTVAAHSLRWLSENYENSPTPKLRRKHIIHLFTIKLVLGKIRVTFSFSKLGIIDVLLVYKSWFSNLIGNVLFILFIHFFCTGPELQSNFSSVNLIFRIAFLIFTLLI